MTNNQNLPYQNGSVPPMIDNQQGYQNGSFSTLASYQHPQMVNYQDGSIPMANFPPQQCYYPQQVQGMQYPQMQPNGQFFYTYQVPQQQIPMNAQFVIYPSAFPAYQQQMQCPPPPLPMQEMPISMPGQFKRDNTWKAPSERRDSWRQSRNFQPAAKEPTAIEKILKKFDPRLKRIK